MNKTLKNLCRGALATALLALLASPVLAHVTKVVGDGAYSVVLGYLDAPLYVGEVETAEINISDADGNPVEGLAESLVAEILGPDGATLTLTVRSVHGTPGIYLADFVPTVVGNYDVRLRGFIGKYEFDEVFSGVEMVHADPVVGDPATISVP